MKNDFNNLINNLKKCNLCKEKFGFEPHPVILGNVNSKIVQISQAPSKTVHETLKPFTDQSGKKLKYIWYQIDDDTFYNPDNFYITALAHCYPGKNASGNDLLPPKICYEKWIKKELEYINNKLTIVLPHPSPLNIKWFKGHPEFMDSRIIEIRKIINKVLKK